MLVPLGAAASLLPFVSTGAALVAGILVALLVGNPYVEWTRRATHPLLSLAVVGLGASMDLRVVAAVGIQGAGYTVASITVCLLLGALLSRALGVSREAGLLISVGTAICGGSAIAAMVPVLRPKEHEVSVALGTVFLLNAVALFVFPAVGHTVGLDPSRFGLWSALAIHDTSSVVGAAMQYGPQALEVATTVKLARALWIVPLTLGIGAWRSRRGEASEPRGKARYPWFILGFIATAALVTWVPALRPMGHHVASASRQVLVLTLFLIGANLTRGAIRSVGVRPLAQGVALWVCMAGLSLGAIVLHLVG
ncbi:YeiH family protein [Vitiosangium sp. GDMCC 1.1324]|uniref:YeiH family protein n=1 Tax=Vitiosangium sp. (strain GDMCC 1.1324) TaxID=2138576 RepID=UPI001E4CA04B|nr:putative sulfate exporter family transporter [Vitiosangium sp. GDMCC 1.1324]